MPVVISYEPVQAIGQAARDAFIYNENRRVAGGGGGRAAPVSAEGDGMTAEEQAAQNALYGGNRGGYYAAEASDTMLPPGTMSDGRGKVTSLTGGPAGATAPQSTYSLPSDPQQGVDEATGEPAAMPPAPRTVRVNREQRVALDNLKATGASGDAFTEGMRKILGLPEPLVDYTVPNDNADGTEGGTKLRLTQAQAATRMQADNAAKVKADQFRATLDAREKIADDSNDAKYASIDAQNERAKAALDVRLKALEKSKAPNTVKQDATAAATRLKVQNELADTEIAHAKAILGAQQKALASYENAQPYKKSNDPVAAEYMAAITRGKAGVDQAYEAKRKMLADNVALSATIDRAAAAPAAFTDQHGALDATPAAAPAASQPATPAAAGPAASQPAPAYLRTATGVDGRKIGFNPITSQWEPIQQ